MRDHLAVNNIAAPSDLIEQMETQLCQSLDPGWCNYDSPLRLRGSTSLDWGDVQRGLNVFSDWFALGRRTVPQQEADRRALICSRCFYNVHVGGCSGCRALVEKVLGKRKTKYDASLQSCGVCKCVLRAKVHFEISTLRTGELGANQEAYPSFCWLKEDGENYRG